jgi:hypothetical protein
MRLALPLRAALLVGGCQTERFSSTRIDANTYRVVMSDCSGSFRNEEQRAKLLRKFQSKASRVCEVEQLEDPEIVMIKGMGGHGPIFGECPLKAFESTLTCKKSR